MIVFSAENGHAEAQLRLCVMYCLEEGLPPDFGQATDWLWEAERAGLLEAALWRNYVRVVSGKGQVRRFVELNADDVLVRNFKRLLEEQAARAHPEDKSAARKWYRRAADGGSRTAQFTLGDLSGRSKSVAVRRNPASGSGL